MRNVFFGLKANNKNWQAKTGGKKKNDNDDDDDSQRMRQRNTPRLMPKNGWCEGDGARDKSNELQPILYLPLLQAT